MAGYHDLHATEWGSKRAKRLIVCAHGYSGNARDFDYLARELARDARVVCIDVAGRGESQWLSSPLAYHFGQFLSDVDSLLAHLGAREIDWVGTSMGGLLGMMLASRTESPVRRLVMNDVGAFLPADALQAIGRNLDSPSTFASLAEVEAHMRHTHRDWGDMSDEQIRHIALHGSRPDGEGYRLHYDPRITRLLQPFPLTPGVFLWDAWYRVSCEVLLLRGERSEIFPRPVADTMLQVKPQAELVEIEDAGHAPALMSQDQIAIVGNFLLAPADKAVIALATKAPWPQPPFSSSPASSRTRTPSSTRSSASGNRGPAPSPT